MFSISPIVGLAKVSIDAGPRGGHDNPSVLLPLHVRPGGLSDLEGPSQVDPVHQVPVRLSHLGKAVQEKNK